MLQKSLDGASLCRRTMTPTKEF
uniref:Uncharacterized protein n=1 Tax=Anguilla anguilla TaxID=7936 RepID=A0A0E9UST2_ANGAN